MIELFIVMFDMSPPTAGTQFSLSITNETDGVSDLTDYISRNFRENFDSLFRGNPKRGFGRESFCFSSIVVLTEFATVTGG